MLRQSLIFTLALSMMLMVESRSANCVYSCMACLMIGNQYCAVDTPYPNGASMCLASCRMTESELPGGTIYNIIYKIEGCRAEGGDVDACVHKLIITAGGLISPGYVALPSLSSYGH